MPPKPSILLKLPVENHTVTHCPFDSFHKDKHMLDDGAMCVYLCWFPDCESVINATAGDAKATP